MIIRFKKKRLRLTLIDAILWLVLGVGTLLLNETIKWHHFVFLLISIFYFAMYFYNMRYQYLRIEQGFIQKCSLFSKKIKLSDVKQIWKHSDYYILSTKKTELRIDFEYIDNESRDNLNEVLNNLNLNNNT